MKILKKAGVTLGVSLIILILVGLMFMNFSEEFGGSATDDQKAEYLKSVNYADGKFINKGDVKLTMSFSDMRKSFVGFLKTQPHTKPGKDIPVEKIELQNLAAHKAGTRMFWFGHSTFLIQVSEKTILIDPMFGNVPAPHPMLGSNRFSKELPIEIEQLPKIDAVLISHDHYDHLDYGSIKKLKDKVTMFYTPLGVGVHLQKWGIEKERIVEMDWWQETTFENLIFKCTPAQHFSGRGLTDRASTLWCSWIIESETENIFFSGDSGYGPHFKEIGETYGPFDFAMLECGQYNEMWPEIHMFPEQTVQAGIDIKAKVFMPIHWGAFKLGMHPWIEPVERVTKKAEDSEINVIVPKIGEPIIVNDSMVYLQDRWWRNY